MRDASGRPVIAGYEILEELGKGPTGMRAFKARQAVVNRTVLLRVVLARDDPGQLAWGSLRAESTALGKLQHPNILAILEAGERERRVFYNVLEWVEGPTLAETMEQGPLPVQQIAQLLETLARAMHCAHEHGVVHRNLKPASILLQNVAHEHQENAEKKPLLPHITDFGLARKPIEGELCDAELHKGPPYYLAPEQAWGRVKEIGPCSDIYALGAILFELLTGEPPFKAETPGAVVDLIMAREAPLPSKVARGKYQALVRAAGDLELICRKCLRRDPRKRYATALDLAEDLQRWSQGKPVLAQPVGTGKQRLGRWLRQRLGTILLAALVVGSVVSVPIAYQAGKDAERYDVNEKLGPKPTDPRRSRNELNETQQALEVTRVARLLALAQRDEVTGQLAQGLAVLNAIPEDLRGWEWHFLQGRLKQRPTQWHLPPLHYDVLALAFERLGERLAISAGVDVDTIRPGEAIQSELRIWHVPTLKEQRGPNVSGVVRSLAFGARDKLAAASYNAANDAQGGHITVWDARFSTEWSQFFPGQQCCSVAWRPDGERLLSLDRDGTLREQAFLTGRTLNVHRLERFGPWGAQDPKKLPLAVVVENLEYGGLATLHSNNTIALPRAPRR